MPTAPREPDMCYGCQMRCPQALRAEPEGALGTFVLDSWAAPAQLLLPNASDPHALPHSH